MCLKYYKLHKETLKLYYYWISHFTILRIDVIISLRDRLLWSTLHYQKSATLPRKWKFGSFKSSWTSEFQVPLWKMQNWHFQLDLQISKGTLHRLEEAWKCITCHLVYRCEVIVSTVYFHKELDVPSGWFHFTIVFHGPEHGQGFTVYGNTDSLTSTTLVNKTYISNSSGVVILGKLYEERDRHFGSLVVDELTFWNRQLSESEVAKLRNMHWL